jgi:hypothetical protein
MITYNHPNNHREINLNFIDQIIGFNMTCMVTY